MEPLPDDLKDVQLFSHGEELEDSVTCCSSIVRSSQLLKLATLMMVAGPLTSQGLGPWQPKGTVCPDGRDAPRALSYNVHTTQRGQS